MLADDDRLELPPWASEAIEVALAPADQGAVRAADEVPIAATLEQQPRVKMPERTFDCVRLDALRDHPAIDSVVRAEVASGVPFRLVRFPFSLAGPAEGRVTVARFTVQVLDEDDSSPRIHSIYPERLEVEGDEHTTEAAIEPQLKVGAAIDVRAGRLGRKIVARHARSVIVGFWSQDGAEWMLQPPSDDGALEGTWEFFVVLRWSRRVLPFRFVLGASAVIVSTRGLGSWRTKKAERAYGPIELTGCHSIA
jgi:hypothetical protein